MTEDDLCRIASERDHYYSLSYGVDIINALYSYAQLHQPKGIMRDLCEALNVDGYYVAIDDAFKLTPLKSPLSLFRLRVRVKLGEISTLAKDEWETAYQWAQAEHIHSRSGLEFFKLQQFREAVRNVRLCYSDSVALIAELNGDYNVKNSYLPFLRSRLGYMPSHFSAVTKGYYAKAITGAVVTSTRW